MKKLGIIVLVLGSFSCVHADSLYPLDNSKSPTAFSFFNDSRARKVGDPLTVCIGEAATGSVTSTSKADTSATGPGYALGPTASIAHSFGLYGDSNSASSGATNRQDQLTATIEVIVADVYSDGTMKIQGTKTVADNGQNEVMMLTGIIRQQDIGADNTISSKLIANASITYGGQVFKRRRLLFGFIPI